MNSCQFCFFTIPPKTNSFMEVSSCHLVLGFVTQRSSMIIFSYGQGMGDWGSLEAGGSPTT